MQIMCFCRKLEYERIIAEGWSYKCENLYIPCQYALWMVKFKNETGADKKKRCEYSRKLLIVVFDKILEK